jgi:hypothetical protein
MNLMCPARLIVLPAGAGAELAGRRVARIYASPAAAEAAELMGNLLGAGVSVVPELQEVAEESEPDAVRRSEVALEGIADQHRGETVVVIAPGLALGIALGSGPVELEHDGTGWAVIDETV